MIAEPLIFEQAVAAEPRQTLAGRDALPFTTAGPIRPGWRRLRVIAGALSSVLQVVCACHFFDSPAWSESLEVRSPQPCCDDFHPRAERHMSVDSVLLAM